MNKQSPNDFLHIGNPSCKVAEAPKHKDFNRIEEKIQMVEEMIESWKEAMLDPKNALNKEFMVRAFAELAMLTDLVDSLYAQWIQLDELDPESNKENQDKFVS